MKQLLPTASSISSTVKLNFWSSILNESSLKFSFVLVLLNAFAFVVLPCLATSDDKIMSNHHIINIVNDYKYFSNIVILSVYLYYM